MILFAALTTLLFSAPTAPQDSQDWAGWRGPGGNGVAAGLPPLEWSEEQNVRWKTEIPGKGISSPVSVGGRIFLTSAVATGETPEPEPQPEPQGTGRRGGRGGFGRGAPPVEHDFLVLAIDHETGEVIWEVVATTATPHEGTHGDGSFATPTIATDGETLFVSFGSVGIFAYDLQGKLLWKTDLGDMSIMFSFGEGISPVLADDKLMILWQHNGDSFLAALNTADGKEIWRQKRESGSSWCTPTCVETEAGTLVIVPGATTTAYHAADGRIAWTHKAAATAQQGTGDRGGRGGAGGRGRRGGGGGSGVIASAVAGDGVVYLSTGSRGGSFLALHIEAQEADGGEESDRVAWSRPGGTPYVPSPILYDGIFYSLKSNSAILLAVDAATGEVLYEGQRMDGLGDSYASPIAAGGRLYFTGRDGTCEVVRAGPKFESLAVNVLDDSIDASPAVVGNTLLLRGRTYLYCIAEQ